ncbi:helix-turn-helix domain-containing protein [Microaceticoccus formicicus]|uniref:helix-turn-helix domain-containing protein n=1 Tax=Microaceticoccus formicicus TaxID=3118105 RepID=UPI003CD0179D|nr:helix-turn-helix transcriptional regulator [Peptoniphilaceae bacterium AMB_02]
MLGQRIKNRRLELGLSQDELARLAGYDNRATISKIESGIIDLNISKVNVFAKALGCSPAYLMGWEDVEEEPVSEFTTAEDAVKFLLEQNVIFAYTGLDIEKLSDSDKIEYANKVLELIRMAGNEYKLREK